MGVHENTYSYCTVSSRLCEPAEQWCCGRQALAVLSRQHKVTLLPESGASGRGDAHLAPWAEVAAAELPSPLSLGYILPPVLGSTTFGGLGVPRGFVTHEGLHTLQLC